MMQWIGLDHGLLYGLEHARQEYATNFMLWVTFAGNWQCLIFIVIVFAYFFTKRPNGRQAALGLALGYLICLVTTETLKRSVGRERPDIVSTSGNYSKPDSPSFPSGHASGAMSVAVGLVFFFQKTGCAFHTKVLFGFIFSSCALVVGISRLYLGVHWPSDVLFGWALGAACGWVGNIAATKSMVFD